MGGAAGALAARIPGGMASLVATEGLVMRLVRLAPLAALATLVLAGCWPFDDDAAEPSPTPSASATPVVSYTVTPSPPVSPSPSAPALNPHPALSAIHITTRGLGPLTVGMAIAGNPGEAMVTWNPTACDPITGAVPLGRFEAAYPPIPSGAAPFFVDGHIGGVLMRIDIVDPTLTTPEGIHVESLLADLMATYPGLVTGTPGYATNVFWIHDAHGSVVFETASELMDGTPVPEFVQFIRVLAPSVNPDWTVYGSGNIADACF